MFYDKFVLLCTLKGVSPSKAAVDAGISKSLVTKWKVNSVEVPSPEILKKLSAYFGVPVSRLLSEEEQKTPTEVGERDILDEVDIGFYGAFKELSEDDKETVRDMVMLMRDRRSGRENK